MKKMIRKTLLLLSLPLVMSLSAVAQSEPKVKVDEKEMKYKGDDVKVKEKKDELKYKSADLKVKEKEEQTKIKGENLKIKEDDEERKVKAKVEPMQRTKVVETHIKTGETDVRTKRHIEPVASQTTIIQPEVVKVSAPEPAKKVAAKKPAAKKRVVARKTTKPRAGYVRTKIVRDTVFVPTPPERIVTTNTEYIHDTVTITRVDTVIKMQTENTYTGYSVPRGNFKKVKLKQDDDGEVWMKRKDKDGKTKTEKLNLE
jgi:hypothetical protein